MKTERHIPDVMTFMIAVCDKQVITQENPVVTFINRNISLGGKILRSPCS